MLLQVKRVRGRGGATTKSSPSHRVARSRIARPRQATGRDLAACAENMGTAVGGRAAARYRGPCRRPRSGFKPAALKPRLEQAYAVGYMPEDICRHIELRIRRDLHLPIDGSTMRRMELITRSVADCDRPMASPDGHIVERRRKLMRMSVLRPKTIPASIVRKMIE